MAWLGEFARHITNRRGPEQVVRVKPEATVSVPKPQLLTKEAYPRMSFFPHWDGFVSDWNMHAPSVERRAAQIRKYNIEADLYKQREQDRTPTMLAVLSEAEQRVATEEARYSAVKGNTHIPRKEKYVPLKRARRELRRLREEIGEDLRRTQREEYTTRALLEGQKRAEDEVLRDCDERFLLARGPYDVVFYSLLFLHEDGEARDHLFEKYFQKSGKDGKYGLYYKYFSLEHQFYDDVSKRDHEEVNRLAHEAADRRKAHREA